jgi:hypothetical protein
MAQRVLTTPLGLADVFDGAGLKPSNRVPWQTAIPERQPGIYVIVTDRMNIISGLPANRSSIPVVQSELSNDD